MYSHSGLPFTTRVLALAAALCVGGPLPAQQPSMEKPTPTVPATNDETADDPPADPSMFDTGACHVTAHTIKTCTAAMTRRACLAVANNVGGVAEWVRGGRCP